MTSSLHFFTLLFDFSSFCRQNFIFFEMIQIWYRKRVQNYHKIRARRPFKKLFWKNSPLNCNPYFTITKFHLKHLANFLGLSWSVILQMLNNFRSNLQSVKLGKFLINLRVTIFSGNRQISCKSLRSVRLCKDF